jgi:hypothetical protein
MAEPANLPRPRREPSDVTIRFGLLWFGGIAIALGIVIGIAMVLFPATPAQQAITMPVPQFPVPTLQSSPRAEMAAFLRTELARLNGFGWIDHDRGIVHIPIADAMRKLAAEGIPGWPTPSAPEEANR